MLNKIKKTKIIATLGPSVTGKIFTEKDYKDPKNKKEIETAKETLKSIYEAGVNAVRFNFSHGTYEEQLIKLRLAREVAEEMNLNIGFILDTKGPEIRVNKMTKGQAEIKKDSEVTIHAIKKVEGSSKEFSVYDSSGSYNMANDVKEGDTIFVDDGKLKLVATKVDIAKGVITATAKNTHTIKDNKRINLPNANYSIPFMSEKDANDIKFAIENNFDFIAASFVNSASNVNEVRKLLDENGGSHIKIISKVETMNAINLIDEIIDASDSIMVARGDLGLEIPYYDVPYYEKYIIKACRHKGKTVIVATQMLDSLETKMQATRAEVTDVFFAVERGADSTMLSGETANGLYPVNAVEVMATIDKSSENLFDYERAYKVYFKHTPFVKTKAGKIATKVAKYVTPTREIANGVFEYGAIIYIGNDKNTIEALSNIRPAAPIYVYTNEQSFKRSFSINYGVFVNYVENYNEILMNHTSLIGEIKKGLPEESNKIIVVINNKIIRQ